MKAADSLAHLKIQTPPNNVQLKLVNESQLHITWLFIGEVGEEKTKEVCEKMDSIISTRPALHQIPRIGLEGIGAFDGVIWLKGVFEKNQHHRSLKQAREAINDSLKMGADNEWKPHLTLARVKYRNKGKMRVPRPILVKGMVQELSDTINEEVEWIAPLELTLYESKSSRHGVIHTQLKSWRLDSALSEGPSFK